MADQKGSQMERSHVHQSPVSERLLPNLVLDGCYAARLPPSYSVGMEHVSLASGPVVPRTQNDRDHYSLLSGCCHEWNHANTPSSCLLLSRKMNKPAITAYQCRKFLNFRQLKITENKCLSLEKKLFLALGFR
jgi:hypothetical protein